MTAAMVTARFGLPVRGVSVITLLAMFACRSFFSAVAWSQPLDVQPSSKPPTTEKPSSVWEVRCLDDSTLRLTLLDEQIELATPFGKLLIPATEIRRIEFGWRNPPEVTKRIEAAVANLGMPISSCEKKPACNWQSSANERIPRCSKPPNTKIWKFRTAEDLLQRLRDECPAERLELRPFDVIHTEHSKIAGRIASAALKVKTAQFGEQQLKLTDLRSLRTPNDVEADPANVLPDPGTLSRQEFPIGKLLVFRVTGRSRADIAFGGRASTQSIRPWRRRQSMPASLARTSRAGSRDARGAGRPVRRLDPEWHHQFQLERDERISHRAMRQFLVMTRANCRWAV